MNRFSKAKRLAEQAARKREVANAKRAEIRITAKVALAQIIAESDKVTKKKRRAKIAEAKAQRAVARETKIKLERIEKRAGEWRPCFYCQKLTTNERPKPACPYCIGTKAPYLCHRCGGDTFLKPFGENATIRCERCR